MWKNELPLLTKLKRSKKYRDRMAKRKKTHRPPPPSLPSHLDRGQFSKMDTLARNQRRKTRTENAHKTTPRARVRVRAKRLTASFSRIPRARPGHTRGRTIPTNDHRLGKPKKKSKDRPEFASEFVALDLGPGSREIISGGRQGFGPVLIRFRGDVVDQDGCQQGGGGRGAEQLDQDRPRLC